MNYRTNLLPWAHAAAATAAPAYLGAAGLGLLELAPQAAIFAGLVTLLAMSFAFNLHLRMAQEHTELQHARLELHRQANIDPLTGLLNRIAFHHAFAELVKDDVGQIAVMFFDLDKFKDINDTIGHRAGDQVLIEVARRCSPVINDAMAFARLGGDEFAALLPINGERPLEEIGRGIVEAMSDPMQIENKLVSVGASVGIAVGSPKNDGVDDLLRRADFAMYEAKGSQRGAFKIFDDQLDGRHTMESSIRVALGQSALKSELTLVYQPLVDARSGKMASIESLLRWRSNQLGDVSPSTLIPIAEESGHIEDLTEWTLDCAFKTIKTLGDVGVAVNISPVYFKHPEFVHRLFDRLLAAQIAPELLILEITEGVLISNLERAHTSITRLRDIGVQVFLDDFGTGYSSLSYLQHFALDGLKLDKPFLRNVGERRQATQIIRTMINFGHSLDMKVVVEGVENEYHVRLLQLLGCDLLQGYEVGAPMPIEDLIAYRDKQQIEPLSEETRMGAEIIRLEQLGIQLPTDAAFGLEATRRLG